MTLFQEENGAIWVVLFQEKHYNKADREGRGGGNDFRIQLKLYPLE